MKMQKPVIFVNRNLKINASKIKKISYNYHYTGKYRAAANSICSVPEKTPVVFHNRSSYDYHKRVS